MRIAVAVVAVTLAGPAHAETGASFELGYVRNRVAVTDRTALDGQAARFAIRISVGRHFHWGAEAEEGSLAGTTYLPGGNVARLAPGAEDSQQSTSRPSPLEGNSLGLKAFVGGHGRIGRVRLGADVAGGVRDSFVSSDAGNDVAGRKKEPLLEVRTRADFFVTHSATIGLVGASDVIERRDVSLALVLALNFTRGD